MDASSKYSIKQTLKPQFSVDTIGYRGHRIRHYGLLANASRAEHIAKARALLAVLPAAEGKPAEMPDKAEPDGARVLPQPCPCCGGRMIVIEVFARGSMPRHRPPGAAPVWIDTS
jgi:hypothetical protein